MIDKQFNHTDPLPIYIQNLLKTPPHLLKSFHYEDVKSFLELGVEKRFREGEVVVNENDQVNAAFLVAHGKVGIWKDQIQLAVLDEGSFLGETFLFSKQNRLAKVVCEQKTILISFERYDVLNFFRKKPEKLFNIFTKNIIEIQQFKINNMNDQLLNLKKRLLKGDGW
ncbi:MAG: cyclic nucleotide-binding domain-containing protein [Balneolaceae bacterium]|nr:cyclic nucleotide-binding domain-containing protein [Balneolaceae bacterium]MCH8547317.1 cyclic nucleotide-binding domain-containing protein [Balneolaceae bacterium]